MNLDVVGRSLVLFGIALVIVGGIVLLAGRVPFLGRLPGDFSIQRPGFSLYFPLATSILISLSLTIVANIVLRLLGK